MDADVLVVVNPISGYGKSQAFLPGVVDALRRRDVRVETLRTEKKGDARRAAKAFRGERIVSFGGDGTFNEVLNGARLDRTVLAVIPAGTGNVLAKELRMPQHPVQAAEAVANGTVVHFDVGRAAGRRFAFACGVGLDAHIVRLLHQDRSGNITPFHYLPYLLKNMMPPPCWKIRVDIDGVVFEEPLNLICVSNTRSYGGPIELTPQADPRDGLLDVVLARLESPLDMSNVGFAALTRGLDSCCYTKSARGRRILLDAVDDNVPFHIDGEYAGSLPLAIALEPSGMRIVAPTPPYQRDALTPM